MNHRPASAPPEETIQPAQAVEEAPRRPPFRVYVYVAAVTVLGIALIAQAIGELRTAPITFGMVALAAVTITSSRFRINVPGHSASVSVSEVFVFASILVCGAAPATVIVAIDGLIISLLQKDRRWYRGVFNTSEPAISAWLSGHAFFGVVQLLTGDAPVGPTALIAPTLVMAAAYFGVNSTLTATAIALEARQRLLTVWKGHALYLAMNYYAAASVAVLVFKSDGGINVGIIGLVAPLLALSYAAYKGAASRIEDSARHVKEVEKLYQATVETLAVAVDAKDQVTHGHIRRVQRHTVAVAKALGVTDSMELRALEAASLLHDVGKLAVPDYVLNKPGALSSKEFERMKGHAAKGGEILSAVEFPYEVVPVVRHHHEQWNGKGYPDGLAGEDIPFGARVLAVVDCFDAVTSDRPYRRRMTDEEGIEILKARRGTMYDPKIVDVFVGMIPTLRLEDRRIDGVAPPLEATAPVAPPERPRQVPTIPAFAPFAQRLAAMLPGAEACIFAPHGDNGLLSVVCGTERLFPQVRDLHVPFGEGLAGWVAVNRHTIVNSPADLDLGSSAAALGLHTCTTTPVFALGNLVGILSVYLPEPRKFSEDDANAVGALAQEIGMAFSERQLARRSIEKVSAA